MQVLGIDIGGSGIKGAPINTTTGEALAERFRIKTPNPAVPEAMIEAIGQIAEHFDWKNPIGCGFPGVVKNGVVHTAANLEKSWVGKNAAAMIEARTGCKTALVNDADAAGMAEVTFGAGRNHSGLVFMITIGTGIGTAMFINGQLVPNTELGHVYLKNGKEGEHYASEKVKKDGDLKWDDWGKRVNEYLQELDKLFWPDLFIIGGGISKKIDKFLPYLKLRAEIRPAQMRNMAGIVGAAYCAAVTGESNLKPEFAGEI